MRAVFIALFFSLLCGRAGAHFTEPRLLGEDARPFTQAAKPGEARGFKDQRLGLTEETQSKVLWAGWLPVMEERTRTVSGVTGVTTRRWFQWGADLSGTLDGAGGIGGLVGIIEEDGAGVVTRTLLPVQDGLGNITVVIDQATGRTVARYDYGPFGEALAESGEVDACPFRWQTKWYDAESQHYYFGYRHYDPRFGHWLSRDPLGEAGGFNLYAYCGNDPVNRHDPLGLAPLYGVDGQTREAMLRIEDERERKERRDNYRNPDAWKIIYLPVALAGIPIAAAALPEIVLASQAAVYSAPVIAFGEFTAAGGLTTLGAKAALITAAAVIGFEAGSGASVSDALQDGGTVGLNIWAATGFGNPNARLPNFGWSGLPLLRDALAAKTGANAAEAAAAQPNRIYSARELVRRAENPRFNNAPNPNHNFPESFNQQIFSGTRTVKSPSYVEYTSPGSLNGRAGTFEIGVRPSASGRTEVIVHRFFRPDP